MSLFRLLIGTWMRRCAEQRWLKSNCNTRKPTQTQVTAGKSCHLWSFLHKLQACQQSECPLQAALTPVNLLSSAIICCFYNIEVRPCESWKSHLTWAWQVLFISWITWIPSFPPGGLCSLDQHIYSSNYSQESSLQFLKDPSPYSFKALPDHWLLE